MPSEKEQTEIQRENGKRKLLRQLVATAQGIITYEIGLSVGAWKLKQLVGWLEQKEVRLHLPALNKYLERITPFPSGRERLNCSREALRRYDEQLLEINLQFHDQIIGSCFGIVERFRSEDIKAIRT